MSDIDSLVTVYMPTFNRLSLLKRAINSVLEQTYKNIELIVIDDGSTDGTVEYMQELAASNPRVIFLQNPKNQGACVSRNRAIEIAKGEFITGLDDDDYFQPDRIQAFVDSWDESSPHIALYSHALLKCAESDLKQLNRPDSVVQQDLLYGNFIGNQVFTKTKTLRNLGGFDVGLPMWQDLECWYRLLDRSTAGLVNNHSYVTDISHPHERISSHKMDKLLFVKQYFCEKHGLNDQQARVLDLQVIRYNPKLLEYLSLLASSIGYANARLGKASINAIKKHIKQLIKTFYIAWVVG